MTSSKQSPASAQSKETLELTAEEAKVLYMMFERYGADMGADLMRANKASQSVALRMVRKAAERAHGRHMAK